MDDSREVGAGRRGRRMRADRPETAGKKKLNLSVSAEAYRRLGVTALMTGVDRSALVESWIEAHCRRWIVQDRGGPSPAGREIVLAGGEDPEGATLPDLAIVTGEPQNPEPAGEGRRGRPRKAQPAAEASPSAAIG